MIGPAHAPEVGWDPQDGSWRIYIHDPLARVGRQPSWSTIRWLRFATAAAAHGHLAWRGAW